MKNLHTHITLLVALCGASLICGASAYAQVTSSASLSGSVTDQAGAVVPGARVVVRHEARGAKFEAVTAENGVFNIPALDTGAYTVTVSASGFKQAVLHGVKLDAGTPASVTVRLEVGQASESVTIEGAGEVLQTQSAAVSTTITGRQITELPFASRDSLDLVLFMPGVYTATNPRSSAINGLPDVALNITIDGINVQINDNKGGDGFFTYVRPRIDAIEEVSVSTATPGAESSGEGSVQIRFTTRSGSNQFRGSVYEYHRNTALNANYWFNNRDVRPRTDPFDPNVYLDDPKTFKAPRDKIILNQYGFRLGGPIVLPKKLFGPFGFDGHDKAFFFVNYEEYNYPQSITRTRSILHPRTQQGFLRYVYTDPQTSQRSIREVDVLALAARGNCAPQGSPAAPCVSTIDPTIARLLTDIRASTGIRGSVEIQEDPNRVTNPNVQRFIFSNTAQSRRFFPTLRLDFNLTSNHHLETTYNYQRFADAVDILNAGDQAFPDFPNESTQGSHRFSSSTALRSTLTPRLVNEARFGFSGGPSFFSPRVSADSFNGTLANQAGFNLGDGTPGNNNATGIVAALGVHGATRVTSSTHENTIIYQFADNLTWTRAGHNRSFGFSFSHVNDFRSTSTVVPTLSFGLNVADPADAVFSNNQTANFPGAANADITRARNLYAALTGRITQISASAFLNEETNQYEYLGAYIRRARQRTMGMFAQDSWQARPNLTLTYGARWEIEFPFVPLNDTHHFTTIDQLFGVSGPGNIFKPGVMTGRPTGFERLERGTRAYNTDLNNVAPSVGFAYRPEFKGGWLGRIFGEDKQTVLRGGFSMAYNRYGLRDISAYYTTNPGGSLTVTRNLSIGNLVTNQGNDLLPVLLRESGRLGPPKFQTTPSFPVSGVVTDVAYAIDPQFKTSYTMSWSFGLQRQLGRNMGIEARYVATRGLQFLDTFNLNELNIVENGLLAEFRLAQQNLEIFRRANPNCGQAGAPACSFAYRGLPGQSPLPITLAYFSGAPNGVKPNPNLPGSYTSANFTSGTFTNQLVSVWPDPATYAANLDGNATLRANALAAGLPANFFRVNPDKRGGSILVGNGGHTIYDSAVVEFNRRFAGGLLVQGNYTLARSFSMLRTSMRAPRYKTVNTLSAVHGFKANWIYELPFGKGKLFFGGVNGWKDRLAGGWEWHGTARLQTGVPLTISDTRLIGMTRKDLQKAVKLRFDDAGGIAFFLPDDIVENTIRAFAVSANSADGYSSRGAPSGRYLAPANSQNCIEVYSGQCGIPRFTIYGPSFARYDLSVLKRTRLTERVQFEFRAEFLNAFNNINFSPTSVNVTNTNMGRVTAAYRDVSTTNDPGGRLIQLVGRINF